MKINRRQFLSALGATSALAVPLTAEAAHLVNDENEPVGMLVDITECIGCRECEWACARCNGLTDEPMSAYEDKAVFAHPRRMDAHSLTVVNQYANPKDPHKPVTVKMQCMHCLRPACSSACIVGALHRESNGSVNYDEWKCIGCRYCMVACAFEVPTYEYTKALEPRVMKCFFCYDTRQKENKEPACADICPQGCLTFGPRADLLRLAHQKIKEDPARYHSEVYGEKEAGGTAWLYLTDRPAGELGFVPKEKIGERPLPQITENLQHSLFKFGVPPVLLFGVLGMVMRNMKDQPDEEPADRTKPADGRDV